MKLVRCEWAPSLVVEWLCGELEERGIPGPTYAHTLLSLLHHHYCPHPAPATHTATTLGTTTVPCPAGPRYCPPLSRRLLDDFDLCDLDLDDLLDHSTHPDADLPDLSAITQQQRGGSRRARKRHKVRQKHRILTSEQLQKVAALQCLMSASDERYDLESLVEELCARLKSAAENKHLNTSNRTPACAPIKSASLNSVSHDSHDSEEYTSSSTPEEQAERYYAAFPPLSGSYKIRCSHEKAWKSGNAFCSCVWEGHKSLSVVHSESAPVSNTAKMPRTYRKKYREKNKKEIEGKQDSLAALSHDEALRQSVPFTWHASSKYKEVLQKESYDTDSASEPERNSERRRKKFVGPLLDEDIGEGYIGDTSSRESSEDRDKGELDCDKPREEKNDKSQDYCGNDRGRGNPEEWECMGDLIFVGNNEGSEGLLTGGGNRLFERGSTSGGTSCSSSDVETQEAKSVKQLEKKISNTVAQVWGQAGELLGHGQGEHVWDPPVTQEQTLYATVWGLSLPKQQEQQHWDLLESSTPHLQHGMSSQLNEEPLTPVLNGWHQSCSWHPNICVTEERPLLHSITSQSPFSCLKESLTRDPSSHLEIHNNLENSLWSDCNANDITSNEDFIPMCLEENKISNNKNKGEEINQSASANNDLEKKILESFMQLSLENPWENKLSLDNAYTDLSISNNNFDCTSENSNIEITHGSNTDSEHEKMMALVEDVCNSDETQEDESLMKDLPSGPIGPHAVLHHTENSGFSMVVPRGKSADSSPAIDQLTDNLLGSLSSVEVKTEGPGDCTGMLECMDSLPPTQEEENLLTSPRTHFRPIRQDSTGSITDDHYEDGTMFIVNSERPDLPFQRTSSGALFLESDILEGSPKKYMVYKEPVPKISLSEEEQPQITREKLAAIALVPKFKVINNEKFCQTEEDGYQVAGGKPCYKIRLEKISLFSRNNNKNSNNNFAIMDDEKDPDVFEFQEQDFPDNTNLANIWKSGTEDNDTSHVKNIWPTQGRNVWCDLNNAQHGMGWMEREGETIKDWSSEGCFEPLQHANKGNNSEAVIIPTFLASLWHQSSSSESPTIPSSMPSLQDLWASYKPHIEESENEVTGRKKYIITNPTTHTPEKYGEEGASLSSIVELGPWSRRAAEELPGASKKRQIWSGQHHLSCDQHFYITDENRISSMEEVEAPGACTELRLEVDQEADELLGAVNAHTSFSQGLSGDPQLGMFSPQPLHERLKKCSSGSAQNLKKDDRGSIIEQEDLADLAPDWELNDGFEWGLQTPRTLEGQNAVADEDEGDGDVLVYESDGVTYTIPIEYLDDSVYDQIFGTSDAAVHRLGGSLPDLPTGHPSTIYFSSDLEDKWKKSGIPYKVQLPRKSRPGRWLPPSRRPCTFFMEGSCRRSDCKFSHDLASITCRFWEEGSCLKGITCPFLHGYPLRRRRNKSEGAVHSEGDRVDLHSSSFEIDSEMDFPALGSSCDSKASSTDGQTSFMHSYHSATVAKKKKRRFITITKNVLGQMKGLEGERTLRRIPRRDRRRRHTDNSTTDLYDATVVHTSTTAAATNTTTTTTTTTTFKTDSSHTHRGTRKSKRHRALASGHDDGTVSDY